jgi:glycosyltransferase involved in cell wall biosynthesis
MSVSGRDGSAGGTLDHPRASVVMTAYNDLRFLDEAVDSILRQDFRDFEFIVVDDGTGQDARFDALARRDPRIKIIVNTTNSGTAAAANRGIENARSDVIVRLDADDVAEPSRLGRLLAALEEDPQLGLVGSAVTLIDEDGRAQGVQPMPEADREIRWTILFHNPFFHSAVAFRRNCFDRAGGYRIEELISQDHYLWFDMLPFCRARNLPEPLARYRINPRGLTAADAHGKPRNRTHRIRETSWARLGLTYDLYNDDIADDVSRFLRGFDIAVAERRAATYRRILTALGAFLAAPQPFARRDDAEVADRLGRSLLARMLASPPSDLRDMFALCRACWRLDRGAAIAAALACLGHVVRKSPTNPSSR